MIATCVLSRLVNMLQKFYSRGTTINGRLSPDRARVCAAEYRKPGVDDS